MSRLATGAPPSKLHTAAARALRKYVNVMDMAYAGEDDCDWNRERAKVNRLIERLETAEPQWEAPRSFNDAEGAASIVHSMLQDWGMAGAVWYAPRLKRFRLVGEGYERDIGEVCVGTYTPNVTAEALAEDFEYLLRNPQHAVSSMTA